MSNYVVDPWKSTYSLVGEVTPRKLLSRFDTRSVGAMRWIIPRKTREPPQVHLIAERDGHPFEELLTDFSREFLVVYWDLGRQKMVPITYQPGQDIVIPPYQIHWLVNKHDDDLGFTCEYAPSPWCEDDEPEFQNLAMLLQHLEKEDLMQKAIEASLNFL